MESLKFSEDETIVKDYTFAKVKKPSKGEAHVVLTNKRTIINYQTKESLLISDVNIDEVRGTDISWAKVHRVKTGIIALIVGIAFLIPGFISLSMPYGMGIVSFFTFLAIGAPLIAVGVYFLIKKRMTVSIVIYTKSIVATLAFSNIPKGFLAQSLAQNQIEISGEPVKDAEVMAREIGVIIQDIQKSNKRSD